MRTVVGALAVLLACLSGAGCSGDSGGSRDAEDVIEIFGPYRGVEADRFIEALEPFVEATGIDIRYVGSVDFVEDLLGRTGRANDPPDLAVVPQPGVIRQLAEEGQLQPLGSTTLDGLRENYPPEIARLGRIDATPYGVPWRLNAKSLVWYRPEVFAENDWSPPRTTEELADLVTRIETESDLTPWCFSMAAGSATGWAATDWVEDLVVRDVGPDRYRQWVAGTVTFSSPEIERAFDAYRSLVLAPGRVVGGISRVVETPVEDGVRPLFDAAGCALYKQGDFATGWMPSGTTIGPDGDVDWFVLPDAESGEAPMLLGGDQIVAFRRGRDVEALMTYLAGPNAGESWVREGGFLSPKSSIREDAYPADFVQQLTTDLRNASALVFDASDQMPPEIGSGLLWERITDWVAGTIDYDTFAQEIDAARAESDSATPTTP